MFTAVAPHHRAASAMLDAAYALGHAEGTRASAAGSTSFGLDYGALADALGISAHDVDVPMLDGFSAADAFVSGATDAIRA